MSTITPREQLQEGTEGTTYSFMVVNSFGEGLLEGYLRDGVLVLGPFEFFATADDRAALAENLNRSVAGCAIGDRWISILGAIEENTDGRYLVAWSP
jgi:hypothetical protein